MAPDELPRQAESEALQRIKTIANCIMEDRRPALVQPDVQALLREMDASLDRFEPTRLPAGWFFARAAASACADLIVRFGLKKEFWDPWLTELRHLTKRLEEDPWQEPQQLRVVALGIPFYREFENESRSGRY